MIVGLNSQRSKLPVGTFAAHGIETSYFRAGAGEVSFQFDDLLFGFSLNYIASHLGRYGSDRLRKMPMHPGLVWVVPPKVDGHCCWNEQNDFLIVRVLSDALKGSVSADMVQKLRIGVQLDDPLLVQMAVAFHECHAHPAGSTPIYREMIAGAIVGRLAWRCEADERELERPSVDPRLRRAIEFIESDPAADHSLESLAAVAGMSQFHFARNFHATTGLSPGKYIVFKRMALAKSLLEASSKPVAEIAFRVGYENVSHFSKLFRKFSGTTPGQIRLCRDIDPGEPALVSGLASRG